MKDNHRSDFIEFCFKHCSGTEDKYELGLLIWKYLTMENHKLVRKLTRLEKIIEEFKLSIEPPTHTKKRKK